MSCATSGCRSAGESGRAVYAATDAAAIVAIASARTARLRRDRGSGRRQLLAELRPPDELPDPRLRDELAVLDQHVAAEQHGLDRADDLRALVEVVVGLRMVRRRRDRVPPLRIEDDDVAVGADRDRALLRVQAEQLRRARREQV